MNDLAHPLFIIFIIFSFIGVYLAFFSDVAKKHYEAGFIPFMPKNLPAYTIAYRTWVVGVSILFVAAYILILVGVSGDRVAGSVFAGGLLVFLAQRVVLAWFTDDYMEVYEKAMYDPLIPKTPHAYHTAQRVITSSLFLIVAVVYVLFITGVIFGDWHFFWELSPR